MESQNGEVVRESAIFAALSPRGYSRRDRPLGTSNPRVSTATDTGIGSLPPVNLRDANSILRVPVSSHISSLSTKTPQSLMMSFPMTTNECWLVWKFLCDWVKTQLAMEVPASIPGFGTFYLRTQSLGIRIAFFEPDKQFLNKFCIQVDAEIPDPVLVATLSSTAANSDVLTSTGGRGRAASVVGLGDVFAFSFVEMAACCGNAVDATKAQGLLNVVIHKLGNAMSQYGRVELNIGIGVIVCVDRVIQRHLLLRDSRPPPRPEYEIRTGESVVKRNLRAQAALQTTQTSTTKSSFLSGSTFSSSIQLNPVLDRTKDVPDFSFGSPNPRRPAFTSVAATSDSRASPRSTQLHKRYQRSPSPLINRISASVPASQAPANEGNGVVITAMITKQGDEENRIAPQLFDRLSRTLCVEPDQNVSYLLPSNRIGSNFTEAAALLMTEKSASQYGQVIQHSGGLVFIEKTTLTNLPLLRRQRNETPQNSSSEQRYFEYLSDDKLIDRSYLAPFSAEVEARVVAAAVKYIVGPSSNHIDKVMEEAHQEFVDNYYASAKKAILNYLLMRAESCDRLGISQGVPAHALLPLKWKWGSSDGPHGCIADLKILVGRYRSRPSNPNRAKINDGISQSEATFSKAVRRKRMQSKLMSLLVLSNPQVRALRYMWHDLHASITLVDLPSVEGLNDAIKPLDIIEFERAQLAFSAKVKAFVMENWYSKTKMMFESALRAETFSIHTSEAAVHFRLRHLLDKVAAVMSLQIRSLIMKSIQAYVNFFELFGGVNGNNQESDSNLRIEERTTYSGLLTTLVLRDGQIQFRDPLVDIPSRLLNVLHNIPKLFYNLGRIETQFEEPIVLPNTSSPFLWNVASQEDDIVVATIRIRAIIENNLSHLRKLQTDYDMFALTHRYVNSVDCFHLEENGELETYRAEMERVQTTAMCLAIDNRHSQHLGLFSVDCRHVNTKLHTELAQWTIRLLQAFEQRTGRMNAELRQEYKEIAARLAKKPLDLYELVDAEAFIQSLKKAKLQELEDKGNTIKQRLRFLLFERENMHIGNGTIDCLPNALISDLEHEDDTSPAGFCLSIDLLSSTAKTVKWRSHIENLLKEAESLLVNERARIESMFIAKRSRFQAEMEEFEGEVRGFTKKGDLRHAATYVVQLAKMHDNMFIFRQAQATIIQEEQKLQWKPTDFGKLDDIAEEMAPYEQLWKTVRDFREMNSRWLRGNVFELPGKEGMQTLQQMLTVVANVSSVLLLNSAAAAITAETVRKQMTDFRENVRLIVAVQNPAMKERHMKAMSGLIGIDFGSDKAITLLKLLENGSFEMVGEMVDISCNATQEEQIERALNEIRDEWKATSFDLVPSRHLFSSSAVLAPFMTIDDREDEMFNIVLEKTCARRIVALMEDHLLRLQTLSCMSHAGPFIDDIALWQAFATEMGQVVEMLTLTEQLWRKLTPLFAAGIVESDSKESQRFANAAKLYRSTHATLIHRPSCTGFYQRTSTAENPDTETISSVKALIGDLEQCQVILETVTGDVRVGFETKRSSFARFYFLSDDELVTALALERVPSDATLWKTLCRCFPGIHSVQTNPANEITALLSSTGEPFPLGSPIVTTDTPMPTWLAKLETSMTTILHASIRAACSDLPRKEFRKWCLIWPEQSLLAAIQHVWTQESEQAYQNPNQRKAWTELTDNLHQNIDAVSKEIRVTAYPHAKATLANIILLLTQLRDVSTNVLGEIDGMLVEESSESSCEIFRKSQQCALPRSSPSLTWIAQPRFYFIDSVLNVTMMTSSYLRYGLEYLGNGYTGMLVTPLTLRCYHAIAQAASTMIKGACLEGAAGIGKSTICHQLARLCGRLYVTFQCANRRLSFDDLANFVKATASSGAWLCIDNIQLLDATTVSMVTMLCAQVVINLAARHAQCTIVGDRVRLRRGALFLLTLTTRHHLNNSLSGTPRDEQLVQDARSVFQTVVVQAPDIEMFAEFEFQCGKFVHASALAKLVAVTLTAFERGFELMNHPAETTNEMKIFGARLINLRLIKSIAKRATELNRLEKEHRRRTRRSLLISSDVDEEHEGVSQTEELPSNDANAEAIAKREEEIMEYRNVCVAIRECVGSVVSSSNLHLIDSVLQDFNSRASTTDLDISKSSMLMVPGSSMLATLRLGGDETRRRLEDEVESYIRTNESSWNRFGVEFGLKTVQLLQTMRNYRAVVLSGEMQAGKTSLYGSLSQALTQISQKRAADRIRAPTMSFDDADGELALVAPTRCVVVCPRALRLGQLLDLEVEDQSHSVFYKLLHEAKAFYKADKSTQTWLVFDGDLDALWSEQLLYTVEELQDDIPGYRKGLQFSSGKLLVIPAYVRIVMETTTLTNASPSFVSRVGTVHVNGCRDNIDGQGWENVYGVWKMLRKTEFEGFTEFIFVVLDTLVAETVSAALEFVKSNFQSYENSGQGVVRVQWMLAMFHSALKQSWTKFCALTSEKQRNTAIHCLFLQALVWGVGSTTDTLERKKFHLFLYDFILRGPNNEQSTLKRLITLFFPNGTLAESFSCKINGEKNNSGSGVARGRVAPRKQTIYDYGFSLEFGSKWMLWTECYDHWVQMLLGSVASGPTTAGEGSTEATVNYSIGSQLNRLLVPTGATASAICLSGQLLLASHPVILTGPKDCGKTVCGSAWILMSAAISQIPIKVATASAASPSSQLEREPNAPDTDETVTNDFTSAEKIYAGYHTSANDMLLHFESGLQRIRIERRGDTKRSAPGVGNENNSNQSSCTSNTSVVQDLKRSVYVFVDDLHCFDPGRRMDSALEFLRMLAEYQTVVDPATNLVTPCQNYVPFTTRQVPTPRAEHDLIQSRDLHRLVRRFVPVALQPFSDSDLTNICESFPLSVLVSSESPASGTYSSVLNPSSAVKEADQLQSIICKASLKLYRLLTSSNDFAIFLKEATLNPIKLHYNFRAAQLFQIVKSIFCEIRPSLTFTEKPALARLWCHESARVLGDSIMDPKELVDFHQRVIDIALTTFGVAEDVFFPAHFEKAALQNQTITQNWFTNDLHFSFISDTTTGGTYRNGYHEVNEMPKLERLVEKSMMAMNRSDPSTSSSPDSMEIIMCSYVIKHVLRVSRLLRMNKKAVLLLGARGRKLATITRLACFICKRPSMVYQISAQTAASSQGRQIMGTAGGHASDINKWNVMLRSAMLSSVRAHDAPLVLIVKDSYLDPDAYPYRTVDQFLGGHSLPSDVVAYEDLDEEILSILREKAQRERNSSQNVQTDSRQSVTTQHQAPALLHSKSAILDYFFRHVRQNLQLVLALSPSSVDSGLRNSGSWAPILWRFPNILKCCDANYVGELLTDGLVTMAQKCLTQFTPADKQSSSQLSEAAVQVYETTRRFMGTRHQDDLSDRQNQRISDESNSNSAKNIAKPYRNDGDYSIATASWDSCVSPFLDVDPSMLVDHLGLFNSHFKQLQNSISSNVERFKAGLDFIEQTAEILETEQTQAELLLPEVQEKTDLRRRMSGSLEREKIAKDKVTRGLELATTLVVTQRERLSTVTQEYRNLINESRGVFEQMRGTLRVFHEAFDSVEEDEDDIKDGQDNDDDEKKTEEGKADMEIHVDVEMITRRRLRNRVRTFASLDRIPSSIYQLSECLGVILGIEPVEGHDEMDPDEIIMNYWNNVAVQMKTAAFWKALMTFDVPERVTEKMVSVLLPICWSPDFDKDLFTSVHEVAGILCEWVQKCTAFAQDFLLAKPKYAQLLRERELLKQAEAQVVKSKIEIYDQTTSSQHASEQRDLSEMEWLRADEKLQDTTSLLQLTTAASKVLSSTRDNWKQRFDAYTEFAAHLEGDLLLATAAVAYASCLNYSVRLQLHQLWAEAVTLHSVIPSSLRRPLHEVFQTRGIELTKMNLNGLPANDESALENAVIVLNSYRIPLLIDPYGVAMDWLKKHLGAGQASVTSANKATTDAGVWKEVETSIKRETSLILTDICMDCMQGLHSFLGAKRRALIGAVNHDINASNRSDGGYRCWCYPPENLDSEGGIHASTSAKGSPSQVEVPVFEFRSNACRVFLIYTDTNTTPKWMSQYLSQLTVIQFELTEPFVETQALQRLLESQGRLRELTEIRALQQEMVVCDEQIYGLEEELLEFFSTEKAEQVYSDNSKALRIVANRSSENTLKSTKAEALAKIQTHWDSLVSYIAVARRCLDAAWAWREFNFVIQEKDTTTEKMLALTSVWQLLTRAGESSNKNDSNLEEVMAFFTSSLQQCVLMNLRDEDRLLFRFLLAFRIWHRRMSEQHASTMGIDGFGAASESSSQTRNSIDMELLVRLLALIKSRDTCRPALKSLLELRPTGMKAAVWAAECYLAEASGALRQFITRMNSLDDGQIAWKALLELDTTSSSDWNVPVPLDAFTRLCIVTAVHPQRFLRELEDFAGRELQRIVSSTFCSIPETETNTPSLSTVVAAAAHSGMTQTPDCHRDLFYMWQSFSSARAPLVVLCPPTIDFVDAVTNVARRASATMDTTDTIHLLLADEASFKKILLAAMAKGQWIVLPNMHSSPSQLEQLRSIYELLDDGRIHSDFRLWISITNKASSDQGFLLADFETMRINQIATRREWGTGFFSLKRSLHHTFAILKQELDAFTFASTTSAYPKVSPVTISVLSESEEKCMKQLGVFHAFVSCRDHFVFAQWKTNREFGDTELCAAIRSMVTLHTEEEIHMKDHQSLLSTPGIGIWNEVTLRGVISNVYTSTLKASQDQQLIQCCIESVLNAWPIIQDEEVKLDSKAIVAQVAVPEVVFVTGKLAIIPWVSIVSAIPHFWMSESCGPPLPKDSLAASGTPFEGITLQDPYNLRKSRQRELATKLAVVTANRGCQVHLSLLPAHSYPRMEVLTLLESLTAFSKNLADVVFPALGAGDYEYLKPISALIKHERQALDEIRAAVLKDIRRLETVSLRARSIDPSTWQLSEELLGNYVPKSWLALLRLSGVLEDCSLERFQSILLDRLNAFSSWTEPEGSPHKLPLDKFLETKYVFEAVHQHFVRNHVLNSLCSLDWLKIVSLFEDSPRLTLPAEEDVVYFTGVRAMGHLQLQIIDAKGHFRRAPISSEGVPVVLQVSSSCLSEVLGTSTLSVKPRSALSDTTREGDKSKTAESSQAIEFLCPLFKISTCREHTMSVETSIHVVSTLPIEQLVLTGAGLHIQTVEQ